MQTSEWPSHFPPCCPPPDAAPTDGTLYMLAHVPPTTDDLKSALENKLHVQSDSCERASLSCWVEATTHDDLTRVLDDILKLPRHRGKTILRCSFAPTDGVLKPTGKNARLGHRSTWFRASTLGQLASRFVP